MTEKARVGLNFKRNVGNFESLGFDVALELHILPDEVPEEALKRVYAIVEPELMRQVEDATRELAETDAKLKQEFTKRK